MTRKIIILLVCCTFSKFKLSGAEWDIRGAKNVHPYRPYYYSAGIPTGILTGLKSGTLYTWRVTNGRIMDSSGNYTLTVLETDYESLGEISVLWNSVSIGSLSFYENGNHQKSLSITIGSGNLTVSGTFSGNDSFDRAYITVENATFRSGCVSNINGYKSVILKPGFSALPGSRMRIYNEILKPIWDYNYLLTRNTTGNQLLDAEQPEMKIGQNFPNPFKDYTKVEYFINEDCQSAYIQVCDAMGRIMEKVILTDKGHSWIFLNRTKLPEGVYFYSLIVDNQLVDTKRMLVED